MNRLNIAKDKKFLITTVAGFAVAVVTTPFLPEIISIAIPTATALIASSLSKKGSSAQTSSVAGGGQPSASTASSSAQVPGVDLAVAPVSTYTEEVLLYMKDIETRVIAENASNNLDDEIRQKIVSIVGRLEFIVPHIVEFNLSDLKHKIKRLVTVDLNGVINPFLKLPPKLRIQNRRKVLDGIKEINAKLEFIQDNIHQKDLLELERGLTLITQRYNSNNIDKNI